MSRAVASARAVAAPRAAANARTAGATAINGLLYSEDLSAAGLPNIWGQGGLTSAAPSADAPPAGIRTANRIVEGVTNGVHRVFQSPAIRPADVWTVSVYLKAGTRTWAFIAIDNLIWGASFNLTTGATGTVSKGITVLPTVDAGNGWWRFSVRGYVGSGNIVRASVYLETADNVTSYQGDGASYILATGFQCSESIWAMPYGMTGAATVNLGSVRMPAV